MSREILDRSFALACAALCFSFSPAVCRSQIYASVDPASHALVLSNFQSSGSEIVVDNEVALRAKSSDLNKDSRKVAARGGAQPSKALRQLIDEAGRKNQISPDLLHAVIFAESRYDPNAISNKGAIGLMQLLPATGKRFGADNLFSVQENLSAGAGYLKWLMGVFGDDLELVLAAYNAGEQAVIRAGRRIPNYPETQAYVKNVMAGLRRASEALRVPKDEG